MNICAKCQHSFTLPDQPKYRRCRQSGEAERSDASLCGEMRKEGAACGPAGELYEART